MARSPIAPPSPRGYHFRHGTAQDLLTLYQRTMMLGLGLPMICVVLPLLLNTIQSGLRFWKRLQMAYSLEYNEPLQRPSEADWGMITNLVSPSIIVAIVFNILLVLIFLAGRQRFLAKAQSSLIWIAEHQGKTVGLTWLQPDGDRWILPQLWVQANHRWQGVGTSLLWHGLNDPRLNHGPGSRYPIVLDSTLPLVPFYQSFGFEPESLPPTYWQTDASKFFQASLKAFFSKSLILRSSPQFPTPNATTPLPQNLSLRPVQGWADRRLIYRQFWRRLRFQQSRLRLLAIGLFALFSCGMLQVILRFLENLLGIIWFGITAIDLVVVDLSVFFLLAIGGLFVVGGTMSFMWWRDWVVCDGDRPVGYIHLECHPSFTILHSLHVEPQYAQNQLATRLIARLSPKFSLPLYVICAPSESQLYRSLGFRERPELADLPPVLRILSRPAQTVLAMTVIPTMTALAPASPRQTPRTFVRQAPSPGWYQKLGLWLGGLLLLLGLYLVSPWGITLITSNTISRQHPQFVNPKKDSPGEVILPMTYQGNTTAIAFSKSNQYLMVSNFNNGFIEVWNMISQTMYRLIDNQSDGISDIVLTPDGQTIIAASKDGSIRVRDLNTAKLKQQMSIYPRGPIQLVLTPDGSQLISVDIQGKIQAWDWRRGRLIKQLSDQANIAFKLLITANGKTLITQHPSGIKLWNSKTGEEKRPPEKLNSPVQSMHLTHDGQWLIFSLEDRSLHTWDLEQKRVIASEILPNGDIQQLVVSPDGQRRVTVDRSGMLQIGSSAITLPLYQFKGDRWAIHGFSPDSQTLIVSGSQLNGPKDYHEKLLAIDRNGKVQTLGSNWTLRNLAIAPDNETLISAHEDGHLRVWNRRSRDLLKTMQLTVGEPRALVASGDNQTVIASTTDGLIQRFNYRQGMTVDSLQPGSPGPVQSLAIDPKGRILATAGSESNIVRLWDLKNGKRLSSLDSRDKVFSLAISPDGERVYVGTVSSVEIWSVRGQRQVGAIAAHDQAVEGLTISGDGETLFTGGTDRINELTEVWTVKAWNLKNFQQLQRTQGYSSSINALGISPDGKQVIINDCCNTHFWDWRSNQRSSFNADLSFDTVISPQGDWIASTANDRMRIRVIPLKEITQNSDFKR